MTESKDLISGITPQVLDRARVDWLTHAVVAFIFSGVMLAYIQFAGPNIVDYDGYYHIKTAYLIREQGFVAQLSMAEVYDSRRSALHRPSHAFACSADAVYFYRRPSIGGQTVANISSRICFRNLLSNP